MIDTSKPGWFDTLNQADVEQLLRENKDLRTTVALMLQEVMEYGDFDIVAGLFDRLRLISEGITRAR